MHLQKVTNPPLKPLQGLLAVFGLLAALLLDSALCRLLSLAVGDAISAAVFWIVGIVIALWAMRRYVLAYSYGLTSKLLRVTFAYGRYERLMLDLYLNNIVLAGAPDDVKRRYPDARVQRAVCSRNPLEVLAIAHRDNGRISILLLQPDSTISATLRAGRARPAANRCRA